MPFSAPAVAPVPAWPRKRDLQAPVEPLRIDLLDFLSLHRCDLGALVGARNGPLGRVMLASGRLLYELRLVRRLEDCLAAGLLADEADARGWLAHKRAQLPAVFWNAVVAGPELRAAFSADAQPIGPPYVDQLAASAALADALLLLAEQGRQLETVPLAVEPAAVARALAALHGTAATPLLRTVAVQMDALERAGNALRAVEAADVPHPCPLGRRTPRGDTLGRVFHDIYGQRFQPWLSVTHRHARRLQVALTQLADALARPLLGGFDDSIKRHTGSWRGVLSECGMLPGT